jgi:CRP-like cAMP-binding protein
MAASEAVGHDPFGRLDEELQALIHAAMSQRSLGANGGIVEERGISDRLHVLTSGWAYRYATTRDGGRQILTVLLPGDICNLDALTLARCDYGVRALTPVTLSSMPCAQAIQLAEQHPDLMQLFLRSTAIENAMLGRSVLYLGRKSSRARMAHLLCEVAVRLGAAADDVCMFEMPLTQEQIADVLGLTSVHVNRTLQTLRSEGLVEVHGRSITIPSLAALSRVAEFDAEYLHRSGVATTSVRPAPSSIDHSAVQRLSAARA